MFWSQPRSLYAEAVKSVRGYRFRRAISFSCRPLPRVPCVYLFWKAGLPSGLVATRRSSLILIGRPFRSFSVGVEHSCLFFSNKLGTCSERASAWRERYLWSGIRLSCLPPHKGVAFRGTKNLHCYCQAWTYLTLTQLRSWPHLDKTVMMWSTLDTWLFDGGRTTLVVWVCGV